MPHMFSDLRAFRRDPLAVLDRLGRSGEALPRLHLGPHPIVLVADPQLARDVLRAEEGAIDKGRHIAKLRPIVGLNSVTLSGPEQRRRRSIIHRTFTTGLSGDGVPRLAAVVRAWIVTLCRQSSIDAHATTAHLTLRAICSLMFGPDTLTAGDESLLIQAIALVEADINDEMFRVMPVTPWARRGKRRRLAQARAMMSQVVARACQRAAPGSLLTALQEGGLAGDALRDEVLMMLIAGHHTTGAASAWVLHAIAADPELAAGLARESARLSDGDGETTALSLRSATTSRALAYEMLRLYPSVHWISRDLVADQAVGGRHLAAGTTLIVAQWHLHRDPRFWDDPEALRLDRNWTANPAYMPFGFGPRACTGMAVASIMLQLISLEFAMAFEARLTHPVGPPKASITLVPPPIRLALTVREASADERTERAA